MAETKSELETPLPPAPTLVMKSDPAPAEKIEATDAPAVAPTAAAPAPIAATSEAPAAEPVTPSFALEVKAPETPKPEAPVQTAPQAKMPEPSKLEAPPQAAPRPAADARPNLGPRPRPNPIPVRPAAAQSGESPRWGRFSLLAASVGIAACFGAVIGSLAGSASAPVSTTQQQAVQVSALTKAVAQLNATLRTQRDDLLALRTHLDGASKANYAQFKKITAALDKIEHAQAEPTAKLAKLTETVAKLEQVAAAKPKAELTTGTIKPAAKPPEKSVLSRYSLRQVYDGVALVRGPQGTFEIEPGEEIRGVGRVQEIIRKDGRWVVVTDKGLITTRED